MNPESFTLILQSNIAAGPSTTCLGYSAVPLMQPTRLLLVGDIGSATNVDRLFDALGTAFSPLSAGGGELCYGPGGLDCWATTTPRVRNVLVVVAGYGPPTTTLDRVVDDYMNHGFEAFGFFKSGLNPDHVLPTTMRSQHAVTWQVDIREIAGEVVDIAVMGLEDRRTFISYSRRDGSGIAELLADILTELRFDVFLDRFQIPPGADFIERISDELTDKAMVVVVETAEALRSDWVRYEVWEAESRRLGLAAVNLTGVPPIQGIDEMGRCRDPDRDVLKKFLLEQHRTQMSEKRQNLMQSVWRALSRELGRASVRPRADGFRVEAPSAHYGIAVQTRPADLHRFRLTHERAGTATPVIIHPQPRRVDRRQDLAWLSDASGVVEVDEGLIAMVARKIGTGQPL